MTEQAVPYGAEDQRREGNAGGEDSPSRIRPLAFFAADHVVREQSGKLYVNGGFFNMLRFPVYPAIVPTLGIAVSLHVPWHAYHQDHHFVITLRDEDRSELPFRIEGAFRIGPDLFLRHGDPSVFNIGETVPNVVFERPGHYALVLTVDGQLATEWPLQVFQLPSGLPSTAAPGGI